MTTAMLSAALAIVALMLVTWVDQPDRSPTPPSSTSSGDSGSWSSPGSVRLTVDDGLDARQWLLVAMTTIWGLRLAGYLVLAQPRARRGLPLSRRCASTTARRFRWISLGTVFGLQGVLMFVVSLPGAARPGRRHARHRRDRDRRHRRVADRAVLRSRRRRPTRQVQGRPGERRQGDGPGPVEVHPPPELLR